MNLGHGKKSLCLSLSMIEAFVIPVCSIKYCLGRSSMLITLKSQQVDWLDTIVMHKYVCTVLDWPVNLPRIWRAERSEARSASLGGLWSHTNWMQPDRAASTVQVWNETSFVKLYALTENFFNDKGTAIDSSFGATVGLWLLHQQVNSLTLYWSALANDSI